MDYMKHLLKKENVTLEKFKELSKIFEMLSNQQEIKNIGKEILHLIKDLKGDVLLARYEDEKVNIINFFGKRESIDDKLENKALFKKLKEEKKPFFGKDEDDCFMVLPILSKENILGVLCIYEKQEIKCWEEINTVLHFMTLILKYYSLIEENKLNNVKDQITDLFNYRHFQNQLELELEKAIRYHIPLSIVMVDIKHFNLINDKLGYEAGDEVLKQVANIINKTTRGVDMPARLQNDTFAILLSNTDSLGSFILLNRLLLKFNRHKFNIDGNEFKVKVKLSATSHEIHDTNGQLFLEKAKDNLKEWTVEEVSKEIEKLEEDKRND